MDKLKATKHLPSISSYQGRYFYLALLVVIALMIITVLGNRYVNQISQQQINHYTNRSITTKHPSQIQSSIRDIEDQFYWQLLEPGASQNSRFIKNIDGLQHDLTAFYRASESLEDPIFLDSIAWLQSLSETLSRNASSFVHISGDIRERFPGTLIMQIHMAPHSESLLHQLGLMIQEVSNSGNSTNPAMLNLLNELRFDWLSMLSEFRLLVANRFSVFSDTPQTGMASRKSNIDLYWDLFQNNLRKIKSIDASEDLLFIAHNTWDSVDTHSKEWFKNFRLLLDSLSRPDWRKDIFYFNNEIKPVIGEIKEQISFLDKGLSEQADKYIMSLAQATEHLSHTINLLAFLGFSLMIAAYFYLKKKIIQPIAETTKALNMEASGERQAIIPTPNLKETRDLVEAFHEMRLQVYKRQQGLDHLAHHDPLTGLPNRILLKDRLAHAIDIARRNDHYIALMFLDLDNFKQVNDSLGHAFGDNLLAKIAIRLNECLRSTDTIARLGGDEFAILIENIHSKDHVASMAREVIRALEKPFKMEQHELHISASIGI